MRILRGGDPAIIERDPPAGPGDSVAGIIQDVRERGDEALRQYEERFAGYAGPLRVDAGAIRRAYEEVKSDTLEAIRCMASLLRETELSLLDSLNGAPAPPGMSREFRPIPSVGCYVPGGRARYPSSAVMSVVPAAVAGVGRIVVVTPPSAKGVDAATVVAADHCGAHEIYLTGGAQAVAALAYGTATIPRVDRIVGPGGGVVTAAKRTVASDVSVDMEAGPTELGIIADDAANPDLISLDLVSQAEHSPDTLCFLLTDSEALAERVARSVESRLDTIRRSEIVRESLHKNGFLAVYGDMESAISAAEALAPEHLQVMTADPERTAAPLNSPGLILLGSQTPSAASDYMLGSNHILPTGRQGRLRGPLSVLDYTRMRVTVRADSSKMASILERVRAVTDAEGLPNHCEAVRGRAA